MAVRFAALPVHQITPEQPVPAEGFSIERVLANAPLTSPHRHTFYSVALVRDGRGTQYIDTEAYDVRPTTVYFVAPGQVHAWAPGSSIEGMLVAFAEDFLLTGTGPVGMRQILRLFGGFATAPELRLDPGRWEPLFHLLEEMERECHEGGPESAAILQSYLHILFARCRRLRSEQQPSAPSRAALGLAHEFERHVAAHVVEERSVNAYAAMIGVTASHLAEVVRDVTGQSPSEIIRAALVLEAKRLLAHTDASIARIGDDLSFNDPCYFSRFFKRESGVSPGEFRRSVRRTYQLAPL